MVGLYTCQAVVAATTIPCEVSCIRSVCVCTGARADMLHAAGARLSGGKASNFEGGIRASIEIQRSVQRFSSMNFNVSIDFRRQWIRFWWCSASVTPWDQAERPDHRLGLVRSPPSP